MPVFNFWLHMSMLKGLSCKTFIPTKGLALLWYKWHSTWSSHMTW